VRFWVLLKSFRWRPNHLSITQHLIRHSILHCLDPCYFSSTALSVSVASFGLGMAERLLSNLPGAGTVASNEIWLIRKGPYSYKLEKACKTVCKISGLIFAHA
jgi:hypothetical protein